MFQFRLPYGVGLVTVADRESPWGTSDTLNPDIAEWLESRTPDWDWDYTTGKGPYNNNGDVDICIQDATIALLFKLTWL
jgi:hypothetical protein